MKKNIFAVIAALILALALTTSVVLAAGNPFDTDTAANIPVEIVEDEVFENHICTITKATENSHRVDCECGEYYRVYHEEESMDLNSKNEFFHEYSCECGYAYTAEHNFDFSFNSWMHYSVCEDCGYRAPAEDHVLVSYFDSNYHYTECEDCYYVSEQHVGVKWEHIDEHSCAATCSDCGTYEIVEHDWDGFICYNCGYELNGFTGAIVASIHEREDGTYRVRFERGENRHYINLDEVNFEEGDYVVVEHYGNVIFDVSIWVEYEVCDYPEHLPVYVAENVLNTMEYEGYDSNTVTEVLYNNDGTVMIALADNSLLCVNDNVIVYDFLNGEAVDIDFICEDERIIWFYVGEQFIILDYFW